MSVKVSVACPTCGTVVTAPGAVPKCPWCGCEQLDEVRSLVRDMGLALEMFDKEQSQKVEGA